MILLYLFALAGFAAAWNNSCDIAPIALPITNVSLSNGHTRRGVLAALGTPPQNISFTVDAFYNNIWVYNTTGGPCSGNQTSDPQCLTLRGGFYDPEASKSYDANTTFPSLNGSNTGSPLCSDQECNYTGLASDVLGLDGIALENWPIGMRNESVPGTLDFSQSFLGLGQDSYLLQRLVNEGRIASRSYSFWWGLDNPASNQSMDGHLILGGYDAAKVTGPPMTANLNISASCPSGLEVYSPGMTIILNNLSTPSWYPQNTLYSACVWPWGPTALAAPDDYLTSFEQVMQLEPIPYNMTANNIYPSFDPVFPSDKAFEGTIQVSLIDQPYIVMPQDALVVPSQYVDSSGALQVNTSVSTLLLASTTGQKYLNPAQIYLGQAFFSGAYLTVNLDNGTFSIWPSKFTNETNLVPIGSSECYPGIPPQSSILSAGVTAGIVIGSVGAFAVAALIVLYVLKKKRKARAQASATTVGKFTDDGDSWSQESGHILIERGDTNGAESFELTAADRKAVAVSREI